MTDLILVLLAVATILVAGGTVFCAVEPEPQRYFRLERIMYAYPLGIAIMGMPMFVASWLGCRLNVIVVMGSVAAAAVAVGLWRKNAWPAFFKTSYNGPISREKLTEIEWVFIYIIVACLAARTIACWLVPLCDWDALCFWGLKAKICYFSTVKDAWQYFHSPVYRFTNQTYPLLCPMLYAWVCTVLGRWDDLRMLAINPLNLIVFTGLLYFTLRRHCQRVVALAVAAMVASLPASLHYVECGQADIPMMMVGGASLFCLLAWFQDRRVASIILSAVLMGGALLIKHEGQILTLGDFLFLVLSIIFVADAGSRRRLWGQAGLYVLITSVIFLPWLCYRSGIPKDAWQIGGEGFSRVRWEQLPTFLDTIFHNAVNFYNGVGLPKWNFLWPILVVFILLSKSTLRYPWNFLVGIFLFHAAFVIMVHLASQVPLTLGHEFALERYTLIMLPPLWLVLGKCLDEWWQIWKSPAKGN